MTLVFSTTKGMSAMAMALAHSRGWLDYEERVAAYWPEFAQAGKERTTVRQLLGHQAGLFGFDERVDRAVIADLDRLAGIMERQRPAWEPGERQAYHAISLGFYEGELIRRVDPSTAPSASSSATRSLPRSAWSSTSACRSRCPTRASRHSSSPACRGCWPACLGRSCSTLSTPGRCSTARSSPIPGRWCPSIVTDLRPGAGDPLGGGVGTARPSPGPTVSSPGMAGSWGCGPRRSRRCRWPRSRPGAALRRLLQGRGAVLARLHEAHAHLALRSSRGIRSPGRGRLARVCGSSDGSATGTSRTASAPSRTATPATSRCARPCLFRARCPWRFPCYTEPV